MGFLQTFLLVFAGVSLVVGIFMIINTFSILVAQRSRELALMRTLGASRRQITGSVILEAFAVGLLGSTLGLGVGYLLARGLAAVFGLIGLDLEPRVVRRRVADRPVVVRRGRGRHDRGGLPARPPGVADPADPGAAGRHRPAGVGALRRRLIVGPGPRGARHRQPRRRLRGRRQLRPEPDRPRHAAGAHRGRPAEPAGRAAGDQPVRAAVPTPLRNRGAAGHPEQPAQPPPYRRDGQRPDGRAGPGRA